MKDFAKELQSFGNQRGAPLLWIEFLHYCVRDFHDTLNNAKNLLNLLRSVCRSYDIHIKHKDLDPVFAELKTQIRERQQILEDSRKLIESAKSEIKQLDKEIKKLNGKIKTRDKKIANGSGNIEKHRKQKIGFQIKLAPLMIKQQNATQALGKMEKKVAEFSEHVDLLRITFNDTPGFF